MSTGLILMFAAGLAAAAAVPGTSEASRMVAVMVWFTATFVVLGRNDPGADVEPGNGAGSARFGCVRIAGEAAEVRQVRGRVDG